MSQPAPGVSNPIISSHYPQITSHHITSSTGAQWSCNQVRTGVVYSLQSGVMLVMAPDWLVIIEQIYCGVTAPVLPPVLPPQQI